MPGTGVFLSDDSVRPNHGREIAAVRFPVGVIRNLKVTTLLSTEATEGFITVTIHAKRKGATSSGKPVSIRVTDSRDADSGKIEFEVLENDRIYLKVDNNFVGPNIIGFNYSFEFETEYIVDIEK